MDYILTPTLSLQYWGQPFISRGVFDNFKYVTDPTASQFGNRFSIYGANQINLESGRYSIDEDLDGNFDYSFGQPDFAFVQWRSNLVLRWEYTPGSELYVVWSQDASNFGDFNQGLTESLSTNIRDVNNIFLLKLTYRFLR